MRVGLLILALVGCQKAEEVVDSPAETDSDVPEPASYCDLLELTDRPFQEAEPVVGRGNLAADFTVKTLDGDWTLSENWTGCDMFVFIPDEDESSGAFGVTLWERDLDTLLKDMPDNVHILFFSQSDKPKPAVTALRDEVDVVIKSLGKNKEAHWLEDRVHYIQEHPRDWGNWAGDHFQMTGYGYLIDRLQQIRDNGSLADPARYDSGVGWYGPNVAKSANEAIYSNFVSDRDDALSAQEGVTVVRAWDDQFSGDFPYVDVTLPSAADMADIDKLELDLTMRCDGEREFGTCGAWDYLVYLYECAVPLVDVNPDADTTCQPHVAGVVEVLEVLGECHEDAVANGTPCTDVGDCPADTAVAVTCEGYVAPVAAVTEIVADTLPCDCTEPDATTSAQDYVCNSDGTGYNDCSCSCDTEIGRWITTYHREGRWVHDASAMLPYLKEGGTQNFRFSTSQGYHLTLDFRLQSTGAAPTDELVYLYSGGGFGAGYNDTREPLLIDIPADATQVDLVSVISGHGYGQDQANCAEFCNHTHHFFVNGDEYIFDNPWANIDNGCEQQVAEGTIPNQFGTWFFGRGGWCPGKEVAPRTFDITASVTPGQTATIVYEGRLDGAEYVPVAANNGGFGASIRMNSWLAYHR